MKTPEQYNAIHRGEHDGPQSRTEIVFDCLPYYLKVYRKIENDTVKVEIHSRIHVNKVIEMPNSWSAEFVRDRPNQFMGDVLHFIVNRYGLKEQPLKYE